MEKFILMMKYVIQLLFQLITYIFNVKIAPILLHNFLFIECIKTMYVTI